MALLNDLKKLLFGAKSVTKSAAEKAAEAGKEASKDLAESGAELWDKTKDALTDAGDFIADKTETFAGKASEMAKNLANDVSEKISGNTGDVMDDIIAETESPATEPEVLALPDLPPALDEDTDPLAPSGEAITQPSVTSADKMAGKLGEKTEQIGGDILESSEKALDKAASFTEELGGKVLEKGGKMAGKMGETVEELGSVILDKSGEALEKAKDFAGDLGSKILKAKDDLMQKANEEAAKSGESPDNLIDKMKDLNQKLEDKISGNNTKFADKPLDMGGSELNKHESFWDKAERFAEGDHHMEGKRPKPGEMTIRDNPDYQTSEKGKVKGFEDGDGDGDELIDDAIIDDDK